MQRDEIMKRLLALDEEVSLNEYERTYRPCDN